MRRFRLIAGKNMASPIEQDELGAGNLGCDQFPVPGRYQPVRLAVNDEGWNFDFR